MILWTFTDKPVDAPAADRHRWILEATRWPDGFGLGVVGQWRARDGDWRYGLGWFGVNLTTHFALGTEHLYYDGPNCFLSLGYLHLHWTGNPFTGQCDKCYPPEAA